MFLKPFIITISLFLATGAYTKEMSLRKSRVAFAKGNLSEAEMEAKLNKIKAKVLNKKSKLAAIELEIKYLNQYKDLMKTSETEIDEKIISVLNDFNKIATKKFAFGHFDDEKNRARYLLAFLNKKKDLDKDSVKALKIISTFLGHKITFSFLDAKKVLEELKDPKVKELYKSIMKRFAELETHNMPTSDITQEAATFLN